MVFSALLPKHYSVILRNPSSKQLVRLGGRRKMRKLEGAFLASLCMAILSLYGGGGLPLSATTGECNYQGIITYFNLVVVSFILLGLHLGFEGTVWMMVPAYISPLLLLVAFLMPGREYYNYISIH